MIETVIVITDTPYKNGGGCRAVPNQRACAFADPPTEEEEGGNPKKVTQCKRVRLGGRRADPTRQYNTRRVQLGVNPAIQLYMSENVLVNCTKLANSDFEGFFCIEPSVCLPTLPGGINLEEIGEGRMLYF